MNNYKVGQIYQVGISAIPSVAGDLIQITGIKSREDERYIQYENISGLASHSEFRVGSNFDLGLSLEYPRNFENSKEDKTKSKTDSEIEITIKINKTKATATIEIGDDYKETIDAENMEITDFIDDVVATFLGAYDIHVLSNKEKYNGKVVCIDPCDCEDMYTLGKIYEFKDGRILDNDGYVVPPIDEEDITDFEEWQEFSSAKWVEVVE